MNMAQQPQGASRFTGIGVVILVHALMIAGLSSGLVQRVLKKEPTITKARVIEPDETPQPPPPPRKPIEDPTQRMVIQEPVLIQPPNIVEATQTELPPTNLANPLRAGPGADPKPVVIAQVEKQAVPAVADPGMVCTKMGKPDLPTVNWAGDALFKVQATVHAGRVTATEFTVLAGAMDPKTRRALQSAIANTLRDTYECPGEHRFEQEFNVRIE